jgi:hypothetical protein
MAKIAAREEKTARISRTNVREITGMDMGITRVKGAAVSLWVEGMEKLDYGAVSYTTL